MPPSLSPGLSVEMSVFEISESFLKAGARCQACRREAQIGDRSTLALQDT